MRVTFSPAARDDLVEIAAFIAQDSPTRAATFVDELERKCTPLGTAPGIGTSRPELGEGIRTMPHGRYLVFYRPTRNVVRIERILHGARDITDGDFESDAR